MQDESAICKKAGINEVWVMLRQRGSEEYSEPWRNTKDIVSFKGVTKCYFLIISNNYPETGRVFYFLTRQNNGQRIISVTKQSLKLTEWIVRSKTQRQNDLELEPLLGITTLVDVVLFQDHTRCCQNNNICPALTKIC